MNIRTFFCNLFITSFFIFLNGCGQIHDNQSFSKVTAENENNYREFHSKPTAITPEYETLKSKTTSLNKLISDFKKIGSIKDKDEFETYSDFKIRASKFVDNPFFDKTYFVISDSTYYRFKYDVNSKSFTCTIDKLSAKTYDSRNNKEYNSFSVQLSSTIKGSNSYLGSNVFGVTKRIDKTRYSETILNLRNLSHSNSITVKTIQIEPDIARNLKDRLTLAYEFVPRAHHGGLFTIPHIYGPIAKGYNHHEPTLDAPYEHEVNEVILFGCIKAIYVVDKKTLKVYGMLRYDNTFLGKSALKNKI